VLAAAPRAQNGSNYHVLTNGRRDRSGHRRGRRAAAVDRHVRRGEDCAAAHVSSRPGISATAAGFASRCVPSRSGELAINSRQSCSRARRPEWQCAVVFTNPVHVAQFPLGTSGFCPTARRPARRPASSSRSSHGAVACLGITSIIPNNGLVPSAGGTSTLVAAAAMTLPHHLDRFLLGVRLQWLPTALSSLDDIRRADAPVSISPDLNQYWMFSDNEQKLWQSQTVASDAGATALRPSSPTTTTRSLRRCGAGDAGHARTASAGARPTRPDGQRIQRVTALVMIPTVAFDVGAAARPSASPAMRACRTPQPAWEPGSDLGPGTVPTLGFATWDNGGDGTVGASHVVSSTACAAEPGTDPGVLKFGGATRVPVVSAGLLQPVTSLCFGTLRPRDPAGFVSPFPVLHPTTIGGASWQLPDRARSPRRASSALAQCDLRHLGPLGTLGAPANSPSILPSPTRQARGNFSCSTEPRFAQVRVRFGVRWWLARPHVETQHLRCGRARITAAPIPSTRTR
jgi:hypothetical protein